MTMPTNTPTPTPAPEPGHRIRMRTVVAGLIALTVSASILVDRFTAITVSPRVVTLAILIGAGVLLLGNGIATAIREQRHRAVTDDPYSTDPSNRS